jgi:hypothetical protein
VAECVRLLYWTYFKPYTFARWLRDIHPALKIDTNPFKMQAEFHTNPRLHRYARQVLWLSAVVAMLAVLLVSPVYTVVNSIAVDWLLICSVAIGPFSMFIVFALICLAGVSLMVGGRRYTSRLIAALAGSLLVLVFRSACHEASGVASGMAWSMAWGVASGVASGMAWGVTSGVVLGIALGMVWSMALGMAFAVALGLVSGVAFIVAFVIALVMGLNVGFVFGFMRVCFWLPESLWMLILLLLSRLGNEVQWLRYLPPRFDELTLLPLPFMGQMIVEAYRENPSAACEAIDYLITSTNQQNVAVKAIVEITVNSLSRCQSLRDIADITDELAWIPSPPPKELGSVLPQLLDISQDVRRADEATSPYRKYELLKPPITALRELLNSLAFYAWLATTFGSITQHWLTILETAQRTWQEQAWYSEEIRQVYIAGNALDPQTAKNRFKGRIDLFREIERLALEEPPPVLLLYGGRRTGKTSTLKYLPHRVGANLVPLLVDLQGAASATTLSGLAENLATQIIEAARRLPRRLDLPYPDKNKLAQDPFPALQDWLGEIERTVPSKRFLLCLDEFERLSEVVEATESRGPLNFLRNVLQHRASWTLLFSGSHEPKELPDYWSDYLINTRPLRVSYLDEDSARELIVQPVEDFTNIYEPTAIDTIIHLTRCQPYLVQLTCYEIVELLNPDIRENRRDTSTPKATAQDVETVIPTVLERGGEYFRELWKSLSDRDRNLLQRLVQRETPAVQDKAVLRKLERKEILEKTESGYRFQVPLVQEYVEQVLEEEE